MNQKHIPRGLYAITDSEMPFEQMLSITEAILKGGTKFLQYREKYPAVDRNERAMILQRLCELHQAQLIINDDPEVAVASAAAGVHLGRSDPDIEHARTLLGPEAIIGISCYNDINLAVEAVRRGADYVAFGSFYPSTSKPEAIATDREILSEARRLVPVPVVAIGGVTTSNGAKLVQAGASLLAVIHGVYRSDDPAATARQFNALYE